MLADVGSERRHSVMPEITRFCNVTVFDGSGAPGFTADVEISGDRITSVGPPSGVEADEIDGSCLALAPGFIDVHTHDDIVVMTDPDHGCKTLQGVTSIVVGNCGMSAAPVSDDPLGFSRYRSLADYLRRVEAARPAVNVGALVGHGTVRAAVMGLKTDRAPDDRERQAMIRHVAVALEDGALGMSSGLAYEPGRFAAHDELVDLAEVIAAAGGVYTTHMRDEGLDLIGSIEESIAVSEATGVPLQISHLKASGRDAWGKTADALAVIDAARERGVDVMADQYPYTRGSTLLEQLVGAGALDGPSAFAHVKPADLLIAAAPSNAHWEGRTIEEIAGDEGVSGRAMADRIVEAEGRNCFVIIDSMSEDDVREVIKHPAVMTGSDGVPGGSRPHPRLHHTYPRVLGHYSRGEGLLELGDAIHRMTGMCADRFGFTDRGAVRPGAFADLVLFDPATIIDTGTYTNPTTVPEGIQGVWVNGERIVADGEVTGARPGRVIRRS